MPPKHSNVTIKDHTSITKEEESTKSEPELCETVNSLEDIEAMMEDVGTNNIKTVYSFYNSSMARKWSLASNFSFGSKSIRSSRSSLRSDERKWSFGSSVSLARNTVHEDVQYIINNISLHPQFLYWPIPAFFLSIILAMVVFTVLALIFL